MALTPEQIAARKANIQAQQQIYADSVKQNAMVANTPDSINSKLKTTAINQYNANNNIATKQDYSFMGGANTANASNNASNTTAGVGSTTNQTTTLPSTTTATSGSGTGTTMDTSQSNVVGLNNQINTLFKNNSGTGATSTANTKGSDVNSTIAASGQNIVNAENQNVAYQNKIKSDTAAQVEATKASLGQAATSNIQAETQYTDSELARQNARSAEISASVAEYNKIKQQEADRTLSTLQPLVDKERTTNQALVEQNRAQYENDRYNQKIENDVALQRSNMAFAKLGLSLTPAAVNSATQIWQQGANKIAVLRAEFGVNNAKLAQQAANIEFEHQTKINGIISKVATDKFAFSEKAKETIDSINKDINLTTKEKTTKINDIKTEYQSNVLKLQNDLNSSISNANASISKSLTNVQAALTKSREDGKAEVARLVSNSSWDNLPAQKKAEYAKQAGLTIEDVDKQKTTTVYSAIDAGLTALMPGVVASPSSQKIIMDYANSLIATGKPVAVAIKQSIIANMEKLPEYQKFKADAELKKKLELEKANLQNKQIQSEIDYKAGMLSVARAKGSGSGSTKGLTPKQMLDYLKSEGQKSTETLLTNLGVNPLKQASAADYTAIKDRVDVLRQNGMNDAGVYGELVKMGAVEPDISTMSQLGVDYTGQDLVDYYNTKIDKDGKLSEADKSSLIKGLSELGVKSEDGTVTPDNYDVNISNGQISLEDMSPIFRDVTITPDNLKAATTVKPTTGVRTPNIKK